MCVLIYIAMSIQCHREIVALTNGQICPQLVRYHGSIVFGARLWIIMEFVDGGSVLGRVCASACLCACYRSTALWMLCSSLHGTRRFITFCIGLQVRARRITEPQVAIIVREVLLGLSFLWKEKKIHRDIKCKRV